jgi:hypothetical protein
MYLRTVQLYNALGNLILEKNIESPSEKINVTQFAPGVYSVRFEQKIYRLIIQHKP